MEHDLAEVAEGGGLLLGDAVLGQCGEDFTEDVDDVGAGDEVSGEGGGDFSAELPGFEELKFGLGVEGTEIGVPRMAQHAAEAAVGEWELTEISVRLIGTFFGHGMSSRVEFWRQE